MEKIGSLWEKDGKNGKYFSGVIGGKNVVIFQNSYKQGNQPDWIVYPGKGKPDNYKSPYDKDEEDVPF